MGICFRGHELDYSPRIFGLVPCLTNSVTMLVSMVLKGDFTVKHYFETVHVDIHMQFYLIKM